MTDQATLKQYLADRTDLEGPPLLHAKFALFAKNHSTFEESQLIEAIEMLQEELDLTELRMRKTVL
jgi:hypothetical protein